MEFDLCSPDYVKAYLNRENVQEANHANTTKLPYVWNSCNDDILSGWTKEVHDASMLSILHELVSEDVRAWVYSGDL